MGMAYKHVKAWRQRNPGKYAEHDRLYKRLRRSWAFKALWPRVVEAYGGKCLRCGSNSVAADHVVPLEQGGANSLGNLQPLCRPCNTGKAGQTTDHRPDKGHLIAELMAQHPEELAKQDEGMARWHNARAMSMMRGSKPSNVVGRQRVPRAACLVP